MSGKNMGVEDRKRWTMRDAVVAMVVVGVAAAVVVAALPAARERARRSRCEENLRQIGLALQSYHQASGMLPPAAVREDARTAIVLANLTSSGQNYRLRRTYANWAILLLPHLGQEELAREFDMTRPVTDAANAAARGRELAVMTCASDAYHREDNRYRAAPVAGPESLFARGNYAINGGVGDMAYAPGRAWDPAPNGTIRVYTGSAEAAIERIWSDGVAGFNKSFSAEQFGKGLSNLVGIDEVRAGLTADDSRGVWALGAGGASVTLGHGLVGDDVGPNCRHPRSDDVLGCNQVHRAFGEDALIAKGMACCSYAMFEQATARSMHPGGVNALLMDGAARFFGDEVDLNIWHAAHSRELVIGHSSDLVIRHSSFVIGEEGEGGGVRGAKGTGPCFRPTSLAEEDIDRPKNGPVLRACEREEGITNSIGMRLVRVPAGEFVMGLPDAGEDREDPVHGVPPGARPHRVRVRRDFLLGQFEVTQEEYEKVTGERPSWHSAEGEGRREVSGEDVGRLPVEQVSWTEAVEFCRKLSELPAEKAAGRRYRLPTEAEWEYACRAGSTEPFVPPAAEAADKMGFNVRADSPDGLRVRAVGSYPANAFGLYDMRGNVFEWCADWFGWDYYAKSPVEDPQGPAEGVLRVVRGADWRFTGMGCHYNRYDTGPQRKSPYIGFRVVCEISG